MMQLRPKPEHIPRLKAPLGQLLTGEPEESIPKLLRLIEQEKPPRIVTVGNVVSRETWKAGLRVDLRIVDQRSMRKPVGPTDFPASTTYRVKNPAGVITMQAWQAVKKALTQRQATIFVEGEEDLLVLPTVVESPDNTYVLYGQPSRGIVVVKATPVKKAEIVALLSSMSQEKLANPCPRRIL